MRAMSSSALQNAIDAMPQDSDPVIAAKVRGLIAGYHAKWKNHDIVPTAVEELVQSGLFNPETHRSSRTFGAAGKIDIKGYRRSYSARVIIDHKTTSQDITDPNGPYWRQLVVESQPSMYMLLEWLNGRKVDEAIWDVVRKPQIKPAKLSKAERALAVSSRKYCGRTLSDESLAALQTEDRETLEMYEARLAEDCTTTRPEWYFARRTIPRLDSELLEFAAELWEHGQEILHARQLNRWSRNSGACMLYGSPCKFLGICSGHDDPDSDRWQRKVNVHSELPELQGDGRDQITNSRVRCFQTCRRKHYYEYELGIERQDDEEREALVFGTIWHKALNAWWSTFMEKEHDDSYDSSPQSDCGASRSDDQEAVAI